MSKQNALKVWSRAHMLASFTLAILVGCGGLPEESDKAQEATRGSLEPQTVDLFVKSDDAGQMHFSFSDGQEADSMDDYQAILSDLFQQGKTIGGISFDLADEFADDLAPTSADLQSESADGYGQLQEPLRIPVPGTSYNVIVTAHRHMLGGCINRNVFHVGFLINRDGQRRPIYDLHVAAWSENGRPCVGIYVTPSRWCWKQCGPSYRQIRDGMTGALVAAGLALATAEIISAVLAPIAIGALAL